MHYKGAVLPEENSLFYSFCCDTLFYSFCSDTSFYCGMLSYSFCCGMLSIYSIEACYFIHFIVAYYLFILQWHVIYSFYSGMLFYSFYCGMLFYSFYSDTLFYSFCSDTLFYFVVAQSFIYSSVTQNSLFILQWPNGNAWNVGLTDLQVDNLIEYFELFKQWKSEQFKLFRSSSGRTKGEQGYSIDCSELEINYDFVLNIAVGKSPFYPRLMTSWAKKPLDKLLYTYRTLAAPMTFIGYERMIQEYRSLFRRSEVQYWKKFSFSRHTFAMNDTHQTTLSDVRSFAVDLVERPLELNSEDIEFLQQQIFNVSPGLSKEMYSGQTRTLSVIKQAIGLSSGVRIKTANS